MTKSCPGKDAYMRMNYLYQLSHMSAASGNEATKAMARFYGRQMTAISKKTVQRLDTAIKRTICKSCHEYLLPGETSKVRIRDKVVVHECLTCNQKKRFPARADYQLWHEKPEALVEILDYRETKTM